MGFWRRPDVSEPDAPSPSMPTGPDMARELAIKRAELATVRASNADLRDALEAARATTATDEVKRLKRQAAEDRRALALLAERLAELEGRQFDPGRAEQGKVLFAGIQAMKPTVEPAPIQDEALNDPGCICAAPGCWTTPCKTRQTSERSG